MQGAEWTNYAFSFRVKVLAGTAHVNYRLGEIDQFERYFFSFGQGPPTLQKQVGDDFTVISKSDSFHPLDTWHTVEIKGFEGHLQVFVDGEIELETTDEDPLLQGGIAFETLENSEAIIDDIAVVELAGPLQAVVVPIVAQVQIPEQVCVSANGAAPTAKTADTQALRWVRTGGPPGGLGYDIRMRPDDPDVMLVTDAWAGVHRSDDGGRTWTSSNDGIIARTGPSGDGVPVFSLTIDPNDHDVAWAGFQGSRGVFKSTDGGRTWVGKTNGIVEGEGISFRGFTVHPGDSDIVYAAAEISSFQWAGEPVAGVDFDMTKGVVYRTVDGGESWSAIWRGDNLARYVWINPDDHQVLYVSTGIFDREAANSDPLKRLPGGVGVLKSTDGGQSWRALGSDNGLDNLYVGSLFMHPEDPDILLAGVGHDIYTDGGGAYLTIDGGERWSHVLKGYVIASVEFSALDPDVAYAASEASVFRSVDGGATWGKMTPAVYGWGPPGELVGITIDLQVDDRDADRVFANNYAGGNYVSEDGGTTWASASMGYTGATLHSVAVDPTDGWRVYAGGRLAPFCSVDGGGNWQGLNWGEPAGVALTEIAAIAINPEDPDTILISNTFGGVIMRTADAGRRWSGVYKHPTRPKAEHRLDFGFNSIAFAPSDPNVAYAGLKFRDVDIEVAPPVSDFGVYKSTDGGDTWAHSQDDLLSTLNVNVVAVHPADAAIVYAGTVDQGVFRSKDGGQTWQQVNRGMGELDVRALAIDPEHPEILYAGLDGGAVYKSTDGGGGWQRSTIGMEPQATVWSIVVDPTDTQTVYAADRRTGVYRSDDGGKLWVRINEGLRTRAVNALAISADGGTLYAATEGEAIYRLDVGPAGGGD